MVFRVDLSSTAPDPLADHVRGMEASTATIADVARRVFDDDRWFDSERRREWHAVVQQSIHGDCGDLDVFVEAYEEFLLAPDNLRVRLEHAYEFVRSQIFAGRDYRLSPYTFEHRCKVEVGAHESCRDLSNSRELWIRHLPAVL